MKTPTVSKAAAAAFQHAAATKNAKQVRARDRRGSDRSTHSPVWNVGHPPWMHGSKAAHPGCLVTTYKKVANNRAAPKRTGSSRRGVAIGSRDMSVANDVFIADVIIKKNKDPVEFPRPGLIIQMVVSSTLSFDRFYRKDWLHNDNLIDVAIDEA